MHRVSWRLAHRGTRHARRRREWFAHRRAVDTIGRTIVLGLGDPQGGDGAVGWAVAGEVRRLLGESPVIGAEVRECTRSDPGLIDLLSGFSRALLVECVEGDGAPPGRLRRLDCRKCAERARAAGTPRACLGAAVERADGLGVSLPIPIEVLGIAAANALTAHDALSPGVAAVVPRVARAIHEWLSAPSEALALPEALFDRSRGV